MGQLLSRNYSSNGGSNGHKYVLLVVGQMVAMISPIHWAPLFMTGDFIPGQTPIWALYNCFIKLHSSPSEQPGSQEQT